MTSVFVLAISFFVLRGVGRIGVKQLSSRRKAGQGALVIMFVFTGVSHFTTMKYEFAAMIPPPLPNDLWVIYLTGVLEIAGAIGLLITRIRMFAGICLMLLLIALFPAKVYAALNEIPLRREDPTPLWIRGPVQLLFVDRSLVGGGGPY
jgi:uncharacterized membrane protein